MFVGWSQFRKESFDLLNIYEYYEYGKITLNLGKYYDGIHALF